MKDSLTLPQLDAETIAWIRQESQRSGLPIEMVVRNLIYRGIEVERERAQQTVHYDLDELAGTWDREDAAEFLEAVEDFAKVDPVLWQ